MLSQFPAFLDYALVVPTFFRIVLTWYLVKHAWNLYKQNDFSITDGVLKEIFKEDLAHIMRGLVIFIRVATATLLFFGIFTQIGALVCAIVYLLRLQTKAYRGDNASADILLVVISISLLFLSPGAFSIDLPL
jgi:uncharacterized membrane protein YphA (DoxX/SURF4 family)